MGRATKLRNGLTPKQLRFAQEFVATGNASEAYRRAYDVGKMKPQTVAVKAHELLRLNGKVADRIEQLREQVAAYAGITPEGIARELEDNREAARKFRQAPAMNTATTLKANLVGLLQPQLQVNRRSINVDASLGEMSVDELRQLASLGREAKALESGQPQDADAPATG